MRRLILVIAFLFAVCSAVWAAVLLDDFNRASLGSNWSVGYSSDCAIASSTVLEATTLDAVCFVTWNQSTYSGNQEASIDIVALTDGTNKAAAAVVLSAGAPPTETFYYCRGRTDNSSIWKYASGSPTRLVDGSDVFAAGDVLTCTYNATTHVIELLKNGSTSLATYDDSASPLSGNRIGISCYANDDLNYCKADNFQTASAAGVVRKRVVTID